MDKKSSDVLIKCIIFLPWPSQFFKLTKNVTQKRPSNHFKPCFCQWNWPRKSITTSLGQNTGLFTATQQYFAST